MSRHRVPFMLLGIAGNVAGMGIMVRAMRRGRASWAGQQVQGASEEGAVARDAALGGRA